MILDIFALNTSKLFANPFLLMDASNCCWRVFFLFFWCVGTRATSCAVSERWIEHFTAVNSVFPKPKKKKRRIVLCFVCVSHIVPSVFNANISKSRLVHALDLSLSWFTSLLERRHWENLSRRSRSFLVFSVASFPSFERCYETLISHCR